MAGRRDTYGSDTAGDGGMLVEHTSAQNTAPWADVNMTDAAATPLHSAWSLWYTRKDTSQRQKDGVNYEALIKRLGTFSTVEQFWALYSHCLRPGDMIPGTDYHLFREGIKPMWEDVHNREGGKLSVRIRKKYVNQLWENLMMALLGEQLCDNGSSICGGVVGIRFQEDVLSVWNRSTALGERHHLGENLRTVLHLPEGVYMDYKEHDRSLTRLYRPPQQRGENAFNPTQASDTHQTGTHVPKHAKEQHAEAAPSGASTRPRNSWWNARADGEGSSGGGARPTYAPAGGGRPSFDSNGGDWSTLRAGGGKPHEAGNTTGTRANFSNTGVRLGLLPLPPDGVRRTEAPTTEQPQVGPAGVSNAGVGNAGVGNAGVGNAGVGNVGVGNVGVGNAVGNAGVGYDSHDWRKDCSGVGGGGVSTSGLKGNTGVAAGTFGAMVTPYAAHPKQRAHTTQHPTPLPAPVSQPHPGGDDAAPRFPASAGWSGSGTNSTWSNRATAGGRTGTAQPSPDTLKRRPGGSFGTASGHLGTGWGSDVSSTAAVWGSVAGSPAVKNEKCGGETVEAEGRKKQAEESSEVGRPGSGGGSRVNIFNLPARSGGYAWGVK